jgi:hypothetical protein
MLVGQAGVLNKRAHSSRMRNANIAIHAKGRVKAAAAQATS